MTKLLIVVGVILASFGFSYGLFSMGHKQGIAVGIAKQAETDRKAYAEVMEKINAQDFDAADDAAVLAELCRLAGFEPNDPKCSPVRRDATGTD